MSAPITPALPAIVSDDDVLGWFAELVVANEAFNAELLGLVAAVQRDWAELVGQLPTHALAGVQPQMLAQSIEALLEQMRRLLSAEAVALGDAAS